MLRKSVLSPTPTARTNPGGHLFTSRVRRASRCSPPCGSLSDVLTDDAPSDRVDVELAVDGFDEPVRLQVTEIDTDPEEMPGVQMFQLWAPFPAEYDAAAIERVTQFLPAANTITPLIGFSVLADEGMVFFRHVGVVPDHTESLKAVVQSVWLAHFALDHLAGPILREAYHLDMDRVDYDRWLAHTAAMFESSLLAE